MQLPLVQPSVRALSITELTRRIRDALEDRLSDVWASGEISNYRSPTSGHAYFRLKDSRSQIAAVMFRSTGQVLPFRPADGMQVLVRGRISVYSARGDLQLYVDWMEPRGLGSQQLALEQLKQRLAAEGLFDAARKRPLPRWPQTVGLVTALRGAAVQDMLSVLRARWPAARVVISPVRVQGKAAGAEIVAALGAINRVDEVDVVIVGRGGGSIEDLWAFNEEPVARAIAASRVPVVSAVGHEIDFTIADLAADCRAPTPTAAAAMVVPDRHVLREHLQKAEGALRVGMHGFVRRANERVTGLRARLRDPRRVLLDLRQRVDDLCGRLSRASMQRVQWARHSTRAAESRLQALSPLAVLDRGYSIVRRQDGVVVRASAEVESGDPLDVLFARGRARVRVESKD